MLYIGCRREVRLLIQLLDRIKKLPAFLRGEITVYTIQDNIVVDGIDRQTLQKIATELFHQSYTASKTLRRN